MATRNAYNNYYNLIANVLHTVSNNSGGKCLLGRTPLSVGARMKKAAFLLGLFLRFLGAAQAAPTPPQPTFFTREDYALSTTFIAVGDVNGDGISDVVATTGQGLIDVLFGNGDGTFRSGPSQQSGAGVIGFTTLVDVNGDGRLDIVAAGGGTYAGAVICLGNGDGSFQNAIFYPAGTDTLNYAGKVVVYDFTGDGVLDMVQADPSGIWLFAGKGDGTFETGVLAVALPFGSAEVANADFNEDGYEDLVVTEPYGGNFGAGNGFYVILGNGNGTFQTPQHFSAPLTPFSVVAGKLGTSGHAGFVFGLFKDPYVAVFLGDGTGTFALPKYISMPVNNDGLGIGDINGDGIPDVVAAYGSVEISLGSPANTFANPVSYPIAATTFNIVLADLRNKGLTDILVDGALVNSVLLNTGKGKFLESGSSTPIAIAAGCGVSGDFNHDGKPDIAVSTSSGVLVLLGTGKISPLLSPGQSIALPSQGCLTQTADVNKDGNLDLVIGTTAGAVILLGNGNGTFTEKSTSPATGPYLVLADFNHDGKLDIATNGNEVALGNGDGTFQAPVAVVPNVPAGGFSNIATADINKDGFPDLVFTSGAADVYILLNNRHGGFNQVPATFGSGAGQVALGDLNSDGFPDMVLGTTVYLGNGKGQFTQSASLFDGFFPQFPPFAMIADVNGDGVPDVSLLSGDVATYLGNGDGTFTTGYYFAPGPSPGSVFPAFLHGQRVSSGLPDLVLPDQSGEVTVLFNETN